MIRNRTDSDQRAIGALPALTDQHVTVTDTLSVVGFGDILVTSAQLPLATMSPPFREAGTRPTEILLERIGRDDYTVVQEAIPMRLVESGSAGDVLSDPLFD